MKTLCQRDIAFFTSPTRGWSKCAGFLTHSVFATGPAGGSYMLRVWATSHRWAVEQWFGAAKTTLFSGIAKNALHAKTAAADALADKFRLEGHLPNPVTPERNT